MTLDTLYRVALAKRDDYPFILCSNSWIADNRRLVVIVDVQGVWLKRDVTRRPNFIPPPRYPPNLLISIHPLVRIRQYYVCSQRMREIWTLSMSYPLVPREKKWTKNPS